MFFEDFFSNLVRQEFKVETLSFELTNLKELNEANKKTLNENLIELQAAQQKIVELTKSSSELKEDHKLISSKLKEESNLRI